MSKGRGSRRSWLARAALVSSWASASLLASCGDEASGYGSGNPITVGAAVGPDHTGQFHLGPVDFQESVWHNACAPYPAAIRTITGDMLAGVSDTIAPPGSLCDACIEVTTDLGRTEVLRVVTYGASGSTGDLDVSPAAYEALNQGEFPRAMRWHLVACDDGAPLYVQFQTEANVWWTSLWIRNPSMAIDRVEVRSTNHPSFVALQLGTDGTYTDGSGFGEGPFTIRVIGVTGASFDIDFDALPDGGGLVAAPGNIPLE